MYEIPILAAAGERGREEGGRGGGEGGVCALTVISHDADGQCQFDGRRKSCAAQALAGRHAKSAERLAGQFPRTRKSSS